MDDEITTAVAADDVPRGRVLQTFLVRVTLRANEDGTEGTVPTNDKMAFDVAKGLFIRLEGFEQDAINATAEKV